MDQNKKTIEVLNDLIKINNDRIDGYEKAASNLEPTEVKLKTLFYKLSEESHNCKNELIKEIEQRGGEAKKTQDTVPGTIYHTWMYVKATFTGNDALSTLEACEFGEDAAQKAYKMALDAAKDLPTNVQELIRGQKSLLKMSHDLVRNQRDEYKLVEHK